jgi:hypothetical protein
MIILIQNPKCKVLLSLAFILFDVSLSTAQDAESRYRAAWYLSGHLMRSSKVCEGDWKRTIRAAYKTISAPEIKAITKAYPKTVQAWGNQGADNFNRDVMMHGISIACKNVNEIRSEIEKSD